MESLTPPVWLSLAHGGTEAMDEKAVIRVEGVSKVFGLRSGHALESRRLGKSKAEIEHATGTTIAVLDASFEVAAGEIFVVIGLSGSGKSTLLRCVNRLIEPTVGSVYVDGEDVARLSVKGLRELRRTKIGMVFQHFGLLSNRTVLDNVTFGLEVQGISASRRRQQGEQALEMVGLQGQGGKLITALSGGMKQRVGLARSLATRQEILLMDEPFSALDPLIRRDMQNLFLDIQGEVRRTVIFVTHDLDEALRLGHRVAVMKDGEIVQQGRPEAILTNPATDYVKRFVEDVDYTKVRCAESVMVAARELAYTSEGPTVVLRRMRNAGLSTIFVVDEDRRLVGLAGVDALAELAERSSPDLSPAVTPLIRCAGPQTFLRDILPFFVDSTVPVAVRDERGKLAGVITRGALIAGLSVNTPAHEENRAAAPGVEAARREEVVAL